MLYRTSAPRLLPQTISVVPIYNIMRGLVLHRLGQSPLTVVQPALNFAILTRSRHAPHHLPSSNVAKLAVSGIGCHTSLSSGRRLSLLPKHTEISRRPFGLLGMTSLQARTQFDCCPRPVATLGVRSYSGWFASRHSEKSCADGTKKDSQEGHDRSAELMLKVLDGPRDR
jgi:hypothetical protein